MDIPIASAKPIVLGAGYVTAAAVAWILVSLLPLPAGLPLIVVAAIHIFLVIGGNALGIRVVGTVMHVDVEGLARCSTSAAAWLAPLAVYTTAGSVFAVPMTAIVVIDAVAVFRPCFRPAQPDL